MLATEMDRAEVEVFLNAAPVVVLDNWYGGLNLNAVLSGNTDGAYRAVTHLIHMGHTQIGHLQGSFQIKNFYYRR